jgi:hypothetical protein
LPDCSAQGRQEFLNAIVGGYALAAYGHPRFTGDLDFWIGTNEANARKVLAALDDFGMGSLGIGLADLTQAGQVIQRATRRDALIC